MIIKGLRWGTDGDHFACGPVGGSVYAEIAVVHEKKLYFVLVSQYSEFEKVEIAKHSLLDKTIYAMSSSGDVDYEFELDENSKMTLESYDYEIGDEPSEMEESIFSKVIQLCRVAVNACPTNKDNYSKGEEAYAFIKKFLGHEINDSEIPELHYDWLDDDDDEDYEDEE